MGAILAVGIYRYVVFYSGDPRLFSWLEVEAESETDAGEQIAATLNVSALPMDNSIDPGKHKITRVVRDTGETVWESKGRPSPLGALQGPVRSGGWGFVA